MKDRDNLTIVCCNWSAEGGFSPNFNSVGVGKHSRHQSMTYKSSIHQREISKDTNLLC